MPGFDVKVPTPARVWSYWVGGKDNFAADREAGEQILEAMPTLRAIAQTCGTRRRSCRRPGRRLTSPRR